VFVIWLERLFGLMGVHQHVSMKDPISTEIYLGMYLPGYNRVIGVIRII